MRKNSPWLPKPGRLRGGCVRRGESGGGCVRRGESGGGCQEQGVRWTGQSGERGDQCLLICRGDCLLLHLAKETFTSYGRWARPGW